MREHHRHRNLWLLTRCIRHDIGIDGFFLALIHEGLSRTSLGTDWHALSLRNGPTSRKATAAMNHLIKTLLDNAHILVRDIDLVQLLGVNFLHQITETSLVAVAVNAFNNMRSHTFAIISYC